jgi:hypothetical protein
MTDLLTDTMREWSQEATVPHDLAARAIGRRATRRRHAVPLLAGLATATAVAVGAVAAVQGGPGTSTEQRRVAPAGDGRLSVSSDTTHNPPQQLVAAGQVAVAAIVTTSWDPVGSDGWQTLHRSYAVLDPRSGRYQPTEWSYVSVAPGLTRAAVLEGALPASRIGILDVRSGDVERWIPTDHPVASLAWSPDGSQVVATAYDDDPDLQKPTGDNQFRMTDTRRTGFVLADPAAGTARFTELPTDSLFGGRADVGFTADGSGVWSPPGPPADAFFDLDGKKADGDYEGMNHNLYLDAAQLPLTSPDGRFRITQDSGQPTSITDTRTGEVYRQPALQVLGWADDEHVVTLGGCGDPCQGSAEFKNGLVLMRYDGTGAVPLTGRRSGVESWSFELARR